MDSDMQLSQRSKLSLCQFLVVGLRLKSKKAPRQ